MTFSANILVIDDDESMRIGCIQTLTEEGYRVQAAENGHKGLEMTNKESFDVILLDLKMPGISGKVSRWIFSLLSILKEMFL
ncbi:unnamed protein product [marine sediment metagenome]|uniref:Response regulatory domain-containing protein n=1 Tax=marine sediment metagenome TaxID=412755 RepID=X1RR93_9ZZZZ